MESVLKHMRMRFGRSLGLGALLAYVFSSLWSRAFFADFDFAFSHQLALTLTADGGCLLAVLAMLAFVRVRGADGYARLEGNARYLMAVSCAGLAFSTLLKGGVLAPAGLIPLLAGDVLCGFFAMACMCLWWLGLAPLDEKDALSVAGEALCAGAAMFALASVLPAGVQRMAGALMLPCIACLLYDGMGGEAEGEVAEPGETEGAAAAGFVAIPVLFTATVALSFLSVDPLPDLFPVMLFFEGYLTQTLPEPGAFCAGLTILFAVALLILNARGKVSLPVVYSVGFIMVAAGYLITPYRPVGGFPLAAGEAGRLIICVFAFLLERRFVDKNVLRKNSLEAFDAFVRFAAVAWCAMMVADVVVVAMQMQPGFDYSDFTFRTVFSGIVIGMLVVLIIRPLPLTDAALSTAPPPAPEQGDAFELQDGGGEPPLAQRVAAFAQKHALSARETEVFALIAAGRDVPYIERELVLSKSTVKTHVKHIYEKCGVSSRQDLLDLFEGMGR